MLGKTSSVVSGGGTRVSNGNSVFAVNGIGEIPEAGTKVLLRPSESVSGEFTAYADTISEYTAETLTGYTTGNTDSDLNIEVLTVLPPELNIDLQAPDVELLILGDIK